MEPYTKFKYIFPPRPETVIPPTRITELCEGIYHAQCKINGACCEIYTFGEGENKIQRYFGRHHNENIANFKLTNNDFDILKCGNTNFNLVCGEYMNKGKNDINNSPLNHVFFIFDILVYNGEYLIGTTFEERIELLDKIFGTENDNGYYYKISENIYRVKTFKNNLKSLWDNIMIKFPTEKSIIEGLVFKKPKAKLERGLTERNNMLSMLKSRRGNLLYKY